MTIFPIHVHIQKAAFTWSRRWSGTKLSKRALIFLVVVFFFPGKAISETKPPPQLKTSLLSSVYNSTTTEFGCESKLRMYSNPHTCGIMEWFGWEGPVKLILFQPSTMGRKGSHYDRSLLELILVFQTHREVFHTQSYASAEAQKGGVDVMRKSFESLELK